MRNVIKFNEVRARDREKGRHELENQLNFIDCYRQFVSYFLSAFSFFFLHNIKISKVNECFIENPLKSLITNDSIFQISKLRNFFLHKIWSHFPLSQNVFFLFGNHFSAIHTKNSIKYLKNFETMKEQIEGSHSDESWYSRSTLGSKTQFLCIKNQNLHSELSIEVSSGVLRP